MKELFSVLRLGFAIFALPLMATAAVSAHQYFSDNDSVSIGLNGPAKSAVLSGTFRNHVVALSEDGIVRGRIGNVVDGSNMNGLAEMKVFFLKDGVVARQSYTDADGSFEIAGLEPGKYSFVTTGGKGFAAFGVEVSDSTTAVTNNLIEVATVSPNYEKLIAILGDNLPAEIVKEVKATANSGQASSGSNRVQINNGRLTGQLSNLIAKVSEGTEVHLVRNQTLVAQSKADSQGMFSFENVEPGVYEFVANGPEGIAALSFEAVQEPQTVIEEEVVESTPMAQVGGPSTYVAPGLDVCTTCGTDQTIVSEQFGYACDSCGITGTPAVQSYGYAGTEIGCGVAAGGSCGSCGNWGGCGGSLGGGGFGGGLGSLAGLAKFAVLGWVLTELFDNIDFSNNDNITPVSPSTL